MLSIIIPSYNEEGNITNTSKTVLQIMDAAGIDCELIFVNDGSKDKTYDEIVQNAKEDVRIKGVEFSRNFGKEAAIFAGFEQGKGDCFVVMDCDLQHPPQYIVEMYKLWQQGYEVIEGIKRSRGKQSVLHKFCANAFYKVISGFTGFDMSNTSDFKLIDKKVVNQLMQLPERKTFFRALTFWVGFKSCQIFYDVAEREIGNTKWSPRGLITYALSNIICFSSIPLNMVWYLGIIGIILGVILGIQTFICWCSGNAVEGFTTVILLLLFIGGCILIGMGLLGQYIAAIYEEVKHRPRYIIRSTTDAGEGNRNDKQ